MAQMSKKKTTKRGGGGGGGGGQGLRNHPLLTYSKLTLQLFVIEINVIKSKLGQLKY